MLRQLDKLRRENSGLYWFIVVITFLTGFWPLGLFLIVTGSIRDGRDDGGQEHPYSSEGDCPEGREFSRDPENRPRTVRRPKNARIMLRKTTGNLLIGAGGICAICFFLAGIDDFLLWMPQYPLEALRDSYVEFLFMGISLFAVLMGALHNRKTDRYRNYLAMLQGQDAAELREIARASSYSVRTVKNDMQDMVSAGIFGKDAWIDFTSGYLILTQEGRRAVEERKSEQKAAGKKEAESRRQMQDQEQLKSEEILEEIRRLNGSIKNTEVSGKIDRIEKVTRRIFEHEGNSPESDRKLRSFLDYYLPTTLKMLRKYRDLERQEVRGENIGTTMRKIEEMMDKVTAGFEKQLDNLYQNDMLDITSDIAAMEQMMVKDGLSDDGELKF